MDGPPKLVKEPSIVSHSTNIEKMTIMRDHVQQLLLKGAIEVVSDSSPGFYSRVFMVPKVGPKKWRPVIDLSALNRFIEIPHFKMETAQIITPLVIFFK